MTKAARAGFLVVLALLAFVPIQGASGIAPDCGKTTVEGRLVLNATSKTLECGPGEPITLREDIFKAFAGRATTRVPIKTLFSFADFQLADEESPLRGEWADKCFDNPGSSAFRPHEVMVPHLMNAHFRAASRIASTGGPILKAPFDFTVALGDLADNQQFNETRWFVDLLDGSKLIDPDSGNKSATTVDAGDDFPGGDDYDGVQDVDPAGGTPALGNPAPTPFVPGKTNNLRNLSNEPFWASGLRNADASPIPWYSVLGNHDMKVQGTIADDNAAWRAFVRAYAVGNLKVFEPLNPSEQQTACAGGASNAAFVTQIMTTPTLTRPVPEDPSRRLLDKADWIAEHSNTTGLPVGHGFLPASQRCADATGKVLERTTQVVGVPAQKSACYSFVQDPFLFITLDTNSPEGLQDGNIEDGQFKWLERTLKTSSTTYFEADGKQSANPSATDRLIVAFAHHTIETQNNSVPPVGIPPGVIHNGTAVKNLLLRFPNVILLATGHSHQNKIWAHQDAAKKTGFWEVNTSAIADYPTQSRTIEVADNRDGTLSIFTVVFDASVAANPRTISWANDDPTDEVALAAAARKINEDWLASAGREIMFNDPQLDATKGGGVVDRNVELLLPLRFKLATGGEPLPVLAATGHSRRYAFLPALLFASGLVLLIATLRRVNGPVGDRFGPM